MGHVVVDGANVVGSRPDGWWRDRPAAARRLAGLLVAALTADPDRLAAALGEADPRVHLVLEGRAAGTPDLPTHPAFAVVHAQADGDAAIVALTEELGGVGVVVVTADRGLRARVGAVGARTVGPRTLLAALGPAAPRP